MDKITFKEENIEDFEFIDSLLGDAKTLLIEDQISVAENAGAYQKESCNFVGDHLSHIFNIPKGEEHALERLITSSNLRVEEIKTEEYYIDDILSSSISQIQEEELSRYDGLDVEEEVKTEAYFVEDILESTNSENKDWNCSLIEVRRTPENFKSSIQCRCDNSCGLSASNVHDKTRKNLGALPKCKICSHVPNKAILSTSNSNFPLRDNCKELVIKELDQYEKVSCFKCSKMFRGYFAGGSSLKTLKCLSCFPLLITKRNRINAPYKCSECNSFYLVKQELKKHFSKVHRNPQNFQCGECFKMFLYKFTLGRHISLEHIKVRPFACDLCEKSYISNSSLNLHKDAVHHNSKPYKCSVCSSTFTQKMSLARHEQTLHCKVGYFDCLKCNETFVSESSFDTHFAHMHKNLIDLTCTNEKSGFAKNPLFVSRKRINHCQPEIRPFQCQFCNFSFKQDVNLKNHNLIVHQKWRPYQCEICSNSFISRRDLKRHCDAVHLKLKPHKCLVPDCGAIYSDRASLDRHVKSMHLKLKFKCTECKATFSSVSLLKNHFDIKHNELHPFMNNKWEGQNFNNDSSVLVKPFKCEQCSKRFPTKYKLKLHITAVHESNNKPFKCTECDKSFISKSILRRHVKFVHQKFRPFKCGECGKSFGFQKDLNTHVNCVHRKLKPFICQKCDKSFSIKSKFNKHMSVCQNG